MRSKLTVGILLGLLFCIGVPLATKAATYYVAPNGNDAHTGTISAPFKTFLPAIRRAVAGDTIYVRGGTYTESNAMVNDVERDWDSYPATNCPAGQTLADGYCFFDEKTFVGLNNFASWASSSPAYTVRNGTPSNPITIKNYPGERPVLNFSFHNTTQSPAAIYISEKAYWIIDGLEIIGGNINMWGGTSSNTHDITIQNCNVHDLTIDGGANPGLIRIDRADSGGAYNITIKNNTLHNIFDIDQPGQWDGVTDMQHFGAITTLSNLDYAGYSGGSTGLITINGNKIYNVPQAFFFKNAMTGPVEIINNTIHDVDSLGIKMAGNVHMYHNLVYGVDTGFWDSGNNIPLVLNDPRLTNANGANAVIEYNTFIGLNSLFGITTGTGHTVKNNVFFGLTGRATGAGWDTPSFITKNFVYQDRTDVQQSLLQEITSDNNCFIAPHRDFQFAARYMTSGIEHYTYTQARQTFGYDPHSQIIISNDPTSIFVDPSAHNYRLQSGTNCKGMGYYAVTSSTNANLSPYVAVGTKAGGGPQIRVFNRIGQLVSQFFAFEQTFRGGVSLAMCDLGSDGTSEIIVGSGPGRTPEVKIFQRNGTLINSFVAYANTFRGGVNVACGDINGDRTNEVITTPMTNGGPQVRIFSYYNGSFQLRYPGFFAYAPTIRGGYSITTADIEGDGTDEIITTPTTGGGPQVRIFGLRHSSFQPVSPGFMAYASSFRGGVVVTSGNINTDEPDEIITGVFSKGGPQVRIFGRTRRGIIGLISPGFFSFGSQFRGGISLSTADINLDGHDEIITGVASNSDPLIRIWSADGRTIIQSFFAFPQTFKKGIVIASGE